MHCGWGLLLGALILTLASILAFAPAPARLACATIQPADLPLALSSPPEAPLFPRHAPDGLRVPALVRWPAANASCYVWGGAPLPTTTSTPGGAHELVNVSWVAARVKDAPLTTTERATIWEVSRVSAAVRRELWARFSATLAAPFEEVSILSPALVHDGSRFLFFSRVSPLARGSFLWYQELPFSFALDAAPAGEMFGIPGALRVMYPGPEDPRVILFEGAPLVLFNAQFAESEGRNMFLADVRKGTVVRLRVPGVDARIMQKNWAPFLFEGALHFLYSAQPLVVLRFSANGTCACVFSAGPRGCGELPEPRGDLRLGTPLTPLSAASSDDTGLFFCALHSLIIHPQTARAIYAAHAALLSTRPWGWVAVSSILPVTRSLDKCAPKSMLELFPLGMVYPTSALPVGDRGESLLMGAHVNDAESTVHQLEWETPLMDRHDELVGSACELRAEAAGPAAPPRCKRWAVLGDLSDSSSAFFKGLRRPEESQRVSQSKRVVPATVPRQGGTTRVGCPGGHAGRACAIRGRGQGRRGTR